MNPEYDKNLEITVGISILRGLDFRNDIEFLGFQHVVNYLGISVRPRPLLVFSKTKTMRTCLPQFAKW